MDGDSDFVRIKLVRVDKDHIVGCHHRQFCLFRKLQRKVKITLFVRTPGSHQFQIEVVSKMGLIKLDALLYQGLVAFEQRTANFTIFTAGKNNQSFGVCEQPLFIDYWLMLHVSAQVGIGNQ